MIDQRVAKQGPVVTGLASEGRAVVRRCGDDHRSGRPECGNELPGEASLQHDQPILEAERVDQFREPRRRNDADAALQAFVDEALIGDPVAGAVQDEDILIAIHEFCVAGKSKRERMRRARSPRLVGAFVIGEHDGPPNRVEAVCEHTARFARLPAENRIAIKRENDHIRVNDARALGLEGRKRSVNSTMLGELLRGRFGNGDPFAARLLLGDRRAARAQHRQKRQEGPQQIPVHGVSLVGADGARKS